MSEVPKEVPIARKYDSRHELEEVKSTEQMKEDVSIVVAFEETRRCTMQENHTILITLEHNEKRSGYMMNIAYIYLGTGH